ncbi:hypothetical protein KUCAC02_021853, partial [Chaenocephalus aceratus]
DRITFPPTLNLPPFHCPSASYKSRLSSADMPLKFRNARMGFEARVEPASGRNPKFPSASYCMPVFVTACQSTIMERAGSPSTRLPEKCLCVCVSMEMILPQLLRNVCNVHKEKDLLEYLGSLLGPAVGPWLV